VFNGCFVFPKNLHGLLIWFVFLIIVLLE
jgi:hypothetical protein